MEELAAGASRRESTSSGSGARSVRFRSTQTTCFSSIERHGIGTECSAILRARLYRDRNGAGRTAPSSSTERARAGALAIFVRSIEFRTSQIEAVVRSSGGVGSWQGRIELTGANNSEMASVVKERLNNVRTPFRLDWRRQSGKPWDWQLVRVSNDELTLPAGNEYMP